MPEPSTTRPALPIYWRLYIRQIERASARYRQERDEAHQLVGKQAVELERLRNMPPAKAVQIHTTDHPELRTA